MNPNPKITNTGDIIAFTSGCYYYLMCDDNGSKWSNSYPSEKEALLASSEFNKKVEAERKAKEKRKK